MGGAICERCRHSTRKRLRPGVPGGRSPIGKPGPVCAAFVTNRPAIRRSGSGKLSTHWCVASRRCVADEPEPASHPLSGRSRRAVVDDPPQVGSERAIASGKGWNACPSKSVEGSVASDRVTEARIHRTRASRAPWASRKESARGRSSALEELLVVVGGDDDYRGSQQTGGVEVHEDPCDGVLGPVDRRTHTGSGVHASRLREAANPPRPAGLPRDAGGGT
jgi:hypothetical protein